MGRSPGTLASAAIGIAVLVLATLSAPSQAVEPQYRKVVLVDGRVLLAEVVSTEPQGLLMRVHEVGTTLISFELLLDMTPITADEYFKQLPWVVYFDVPEDIEPDVVDLLKAMGVEPQPVRMQGNGVTQSMAAIAQNSCGDQMRDPRCIAHAVSAADQWLWVVTADFVASGVLLQGKVNKSGDDAPTRLELSGAGRDELWEGLHEVLGLVSDDIGNAPRGTGGPVGPVTARRPFDEGRVVALSFVPFPGVPSLAQRDAGGFALAMSVVVPSTALWVGMVGNNQQSLVETGALAVGGYYAVTVLANQIAGLRSMERMGSKRQVGVMAAPTTAGGVQLVVVGSE